MNPASKWRFEIAERVALNYAENRSVPVVMVGGSTTCGHADRYSDTEIGVFWYRAPTESVRKTIVKQSGADLLRL